MRYAAILITLILNILVAYTPSFAFFSAKDTVIDASLADQLLRECLLKTDRKSRVERTEALIGELADTIKNITKIDISKSIKDTLKNNKQISSFKFSEANNQGYDVVPIMIEFEIKGLGKGTLYGVSSEASIIGGKFPEFFGFTRALLNGVDCPDNSIVYYLGRIVYGLNDEGMKELNKGHLAIAPRISGPRIDIVEAYRKFISWEKSFLTSNDATSGVSDSSKHKENTSEENLHNQTPSHQSLAINNQDKNTKDNILSHERQRMEKVLQDEKRRLDLINKQVEMNKAYKTDTIELLLDANGKNIWGADGKPVRIINGEVYIAAGTPKETINQINAALAVAKRNKPSTQLPHTPLQASQANPDTAKTLKMTEQLHNQYRSTSAAYAQADDLLNATWKQVKPNVSEDVYKQTLQEQREWAAKGRDAAASQYAVSMTEVEAFTKVLLDRNAELMTLIGAKQQSGRDEAKYASQSETNVGSKQVSHTGTIEVQREAGMPMFYLHVENGKPIHIGPRGIFSDKTNDCLDTAEGENIRVEIVGTLKRYGDGTISFDIDESESLQCRLINGTGSTQENTKLVTITGIAERPATGLQATAAFVSDDGEGYSFELSSKTAEAIYNTCGDSKCKMTCVIDKHYNILQINEIQLIK